MKEILLRLFEELERIGAEHEELYDTEVRNAMGRAIFEGFLKPQGNPLPSLFLDSDEANRHVNEALQRYIDAAKQHAKELGVVTFKKRLAAFQDTSVFTKQGNTSDDFFGSYNPAAYDEEGRFLRELWQDDRRTGNETSR